MRRRTRILALLSVPVLLLSLTAGTAGASVIEDYARVIRSRHASATFVEVDGCRQVEVFLSAMDAKFGARGGRVNKQGLVGVFYAERDICVEPGPKGYPITYSADGMSLDQLGSTPQFGAAWVRATIPGTDSEGNEVNIGLDVSWSLLGAFERSRVSNNAWFPANGQRGAHVHTFSHGLQADCHRAGHGEPGWAIDRAGADQRRDARADPLLLPGHPAPARRLRRRLLGRALQDPPLGEGGLGRGRLARAVQVVHGMHDAPRQVRHVGARPVELGHQDCGIGMGLADRVMQVAQRV